MKLILRLVRTARRSNIRQHIKYFVLYVLCAFFLTAELLVGYSYMVSFDNKLSDTYGEQDATIADSADYAPTLDNDPRVKSYAMSASYLLTSDRISVGTVSAEAVDIQHITLAEGRLPVSDNEIAIEKTVLSIFYNSAAIGDTVVIDSQYSFTLCGIIDDYASLQWESDTNGFAMPNAIITEAAATQIFSRPIVTFFELILRDDVVPDKYVEEMRQSKAVTAIFANLATSSSLASQYLDNKNLILPAIMLVGILLVVSALIYIASVSNRQNLAKMAELKIVGMDNRSIKTYFLLQGLDRSVLAGIIGSVLGAVVVSVTMGFLNELSFHYNLWLFLIGLLVSIVLPPVLSSLSMRRYYNLSVVELMRPAPEYSDSMSRSKYINSNDPIVLCATRNYYSNGSRGATFRVLMFVSIAVVACTLFLSTRIIADATNTFSDGDIAISHSGGWTVDRDGYVPVTPFNGISEHEYSLLKKSTYASRVVGVKYMTVFSAKNKASVPADDQWPDSEKYKADFGFPADVCVGPQRIYGLDSDILELLAPYTDGCDNYLELLKDGKHVLHIKRYDGESMYKVGDNMRFIQHIPGDKPYMMDISAEVVGVIDYQQIPNGLSDIRRGLAGGFLWQNDCFAKNDLPALFQEIYITVKNPADTGDIDKLVSDIKYVYGNGIFVRTNLQNKLAKIEQGKIISAVGYMICGILILFSTLCLSITLNVKINKRRSTLGILRAIGMSKKQQYLSLLFETWFDVLYVWIVSAITATIMCVLYASRPIIEAKLMTGSVPEDIMAKFSLSGFPLLALILMVVLYLFASFIVCILPIRKFYKESNVECIRCE